LTAAAAAKLVAIARATSKTDPIRLVGLSTAAGCMFVRSYTRSQRPTAAHACIVGPNL
jgi:hypothetical protein